MKQRVDGMRRNKLKKIPKLNIFSVYILVIVIMDLIFYPLFPILLNYPPGSINSQFDIEFSKIPYYQQYFIINLIIILIGYICFKFIFKDVQNWDRILNALKSNDREVIIKIRHKSYSIPHLVCIMQIVIPIVFVGILFIILGFNNSADIKFFIVLTTFLSMVAVISYLFSKKYFRKVLMYTYIEGIDDKTHRIKLPVKITIQIMPLFLLALLFMVLIGQSGIVKEKGDVLFQKFQDDLKVKLAKVSYIESEAQIKQLIKIIESDDLNNIAFYIDPNGRYNTSDNSKLSDFFIKYSRELAFKYNGHTYDYYGSDVQGAIIKIKGFNGDWIIGIKYVVTSTNTTTLFIISFVMLSLFAVLLLLYFGKTIADDIKLITFGLNEIAEGVESNLNSKIPVISNDEIGDLVVAFNIVQEREKKYVEDIKNQQKVIIEQEKLASLGQIISGITHNLKTPIISLSNAMDSLKNLVTEYRVSIGDQRVSNEDHFEIAGEMDSLLIDMKPHCDYMNDVLETIKGQVIKGKQSLTSGFSLRELIKRVEIITYYELTKSGCIVNYDVKADLNLGIPGEISDLVQVLANLISNSIQAYQSKGGRIELMVIQKGASLEFQIKDSGIGIPDVIQTKLFKEINTTKGKKGTGLGLYISYAIIKGKFGGEIWFKSTEEKGTIFYISIPLTL